MNDRSDTKRSLAAPNSSAAEIVERDTAVTGTPAEEGEASEDSSAGGDEATPPPGKDSPAG